MGSSNGSAQPEVKAEEVPVEVKQVLIQQDLQIWRNTRYQHQLRYRVQQKLSKISDTSAMVKELEMELMRCEAAIEELETALHELDDQSNSREK